MWRPKLRKRHTASMEESDWPGVVPSTATAAMKDDRLFRFKQQTLKTYIVTFAPRLVIGIYFVIALLFIPLGATVIAGSADIRATSASVYGSVSRCAQTPNRNGENICYIRFDVPRDIPAKSYLFYVITNMHQNLRNYVKSRSVTQLRGKTPEEPADIEDCGALRFIDPFTNRPGNYFDSKDNKFNISEIRNPCGLTADSVFNDTFEICRNSDCTSYFQTSRKGIAWRTDVADKYKPGLPEHFTKDVNSKLKNEAFIVWMRLSTFSRVEKLYSIITEPIPKGNYTMKINSIYPVLSFKGNKQFFISSTKWFGTRNLFLGVLLLTVGIIALVVALVVLGTHVVYPRPPAYYDPDIIRGELAKLSIEYGQTN